LLDGVAVGAGVVGRAARAGADRGVLARRAGALALATGAEDALMLGPGAGRLTLAEGAGVLVLTSGAGLVESVIDDGQVTATAAASCVWRGDTTATSTAL
jgi:hypothetical protein